MAEPLDLNAILQMFKVGPTEAERQSAKDFAIGRMGLGILAANQPTRYPKSSLGVLAQGGLQGMDAYHGELKYLTDERKAGGAAALQAMQIKKLLEQQEALKNFNNNPVVAPTGATPAGMSSDTSLAAFGTPDFATAPPPQPAPQIPDYESLIKGGVPAPQVNALMETFKLRYPDVKFDQSGMPRHGRTGQLIAGVPAAAHINQQGFGTTPRINAQGQIEIGPTPGSEGTYATQQDIGERAKAGYDLVTVPPTSAGAPPTYASRLGLLRSGAGVNPQTQIAPRPAAGMSPTATAAQAANAAQQLEVAKNYGKIYNDAQNAAMVNPAKIAKFERIGTLLGDFEGGKLSKTGLEIARLGNSMNVRIDPMLPNKEASEALSNEVALELRSTGSGGGVGMPGSLSDADREFLRSMTPQMSQTPEGRKAIIDSRVKVLNRETQVAKMARQYKQKYGVLDEDFFNQLSAWAERNPIFKK